MEPIPSAWSVVDPIAAPPAPVPPAAGAARFVRVASVVVALVAAAFVGAIVVASLPAAQPRSLALPSLGASATTDGGLVVVEVVGAVRHPGLVRLPTSSRVADAIAAAGGFSPAVDARGVAASLRLAAQVADGDQVRVPARGEQPSRAPTAADDSGGAVPSGPIDVNAATEAQLDTLPGIGPVTAGKIVAARRERRFASVDELLERKVVGPATLEKIRDLIVVR